MVTIWLLSVIMTFSTQLAEGVIIETSLKYISYNDFKLFDVATSLQMS